MALDTYLAQAQRLAGWDVTNQLEASLGGLLDLHQKVSAELMVAMLGQSTEPNPEARRHLEPLIQALGALDRELRKVVDTLRGLATIEEQVTRERKVLASRTVPETGI